MHAVSLRDLYDDHDAQRVTDVQWIADAGQEGWAALTQNFRISQNPLEREAILRNGTKIYSFPRADWNQTTQGLVVGRNLLRMFRRDQRSDGCFWRISERAPVKDIP